MSVESKSLDELNKTLLVDTIETGTYTPTITPLANIDSITPKPLRYTKVGNMVNVSGQIDIDATAVDTLTNYRISLPVPSNLIDNGNLSGTTSIIAFSPSAIRSGYIRGEVAEDEAYVSFSASVTGLVGTTVSFEYEIK